MGRTESENVTTNNQTVQQYLLIFGLSLSQEFLDTKSILLFVFWLKRKTLEAQSGHLTNFSKVSVKAMCQQLWQNKSVIQSQDDKSYSWFCPGQYLEVNAAAKPYHIKKIYTSYESYPPQGSISLQVTLLLTSFTNILFTQPVLYIPSVYILYSIHIHVYMNRDLLHLHQPGRPLSWYAHTGIFSTQCTSFCRFINPEKVN